MKRIVVIGAGGHGREVAEIVVRSGAELVGFIDDDPTLWDGTVDGVRVLGDMSWFDVARHVEVVIAIGNPVVVRKVAAQAEERGLRFGQAISPDAVISGHATLGRGVVIFPGCFVSTRARLGDFVAMNVGSSVSHDSTVGRYTILNPGVRLAGNVTVGEGCYVGMGTVVSHGRKVGSWCRLGAGSAVVRDLPDGVTAVGVPAAVAKKLG